MENWKIGKGGGCIVTDTKEGFTDGEKGGWTGEDAISHYGGVMVCESINRPKDAKLIAAAPDLLMVLRRAQQLLHNYRLEDIDDERKDRIRIVLNDSIDVVKRATQ